MDDVQGSMFDQPPVDVLNSKPKTTEAGTLLFLNWYISGKWKELHFTFQRAVV